METEKEITPDVPDNRPKSSYNSVWTGLIAGIIVPCLTIIFFYVGGALKVSVNEFVTTFLYLGVFSSLVALCVIPNLLLFFIFIWKKLLYSARGVIFATAFWAFAIVFIKFVMQSGTFME